MKLKRIFALLLSFAIAAACLTSCADIDVEGILQDVETILQEETLQTEFPNESKPEAETENEQKPDPAENADTQSDTETETENNSDDEATADTPSDTETENENKPDAEENEEEQSEPALDENGVYTSKEDVALYIHTYGRLPSNFITKSEARALGWDGGKLEPYAPGKSIGGDYFGNYEGILPEKKGRKYTECDIDTLGKSRGEKRIVFSNDGLIYYTDDHYESFTLLYGEE
jgi:hypothetical protein